MSQLFPRVVHELRRSARSLMRRERPDHTLQPTALIHEALLRLIPQPIAWRNRRQFFAVATQMMKRALWDHARARAADKRGACAEHLPMDEQEIGSEPIRTGDEKVREALGELATKDPRQSQIVELHVFGGLSKSKIAEELGISRMTVHRDWVTARSWLHDRLGRS